MCAKFHLNQLNTFRDTADCNLKFRKTAKMAAILDFFKT